MGGKTQQRVAGNAKPTSSGRIRELMINQQQGLSNIITFSTLANNPKHDQKEKSNEPKTSESKQFKQADKLTSDSSSIVKDKSKTEQTSQELKQKLIVRRVGNRDFFTRVKVPLDSIPPQTQSQVATSSATLDSFDKELDLPTDQEQIKLDEHIVLESIDKSKLDGDNNDQEVEEECKDKVYDFDTILDELTKIQDNRKSVKNDAISLRDLSDVEINQEIELIRILRILIRDFREDLSIEEWDLVVSSIYKWGALITQTEEILNNTIWRNFCIDFFNFITILISLAKQWKETKNVQEKIPLMDLLLFDWDSFHSSEVYKDLILMYYKLISIVSTNPRDEDLIVVEALSGIVIEVDSKSMICSGDLAEYSKVEKIDFDPEIRISGQHKYCDIDTNTKYKGFISICNLLKSNLRFVIITAHRMLSNVMDLLSESVSNRFIENEDDLNTILLLPPQPLMSILTSYDSMISILLSDYKVGDISVTIEPNTDAYTCTLSYLFVWDLVIHFIVGLNKEDGHKMIHCLKKLGLIQRLLDNIFILLPPLGEKDSLRFGFEAKSSNRRSLSQAGSLVEPATTTKNCSLNDFLKSPLKTTLLRPKNEIELIALHVYFSIALHMPVTVRKWYNNNSNKKLSNLVNEYTVKHISQIICTLEMETVHEKCQERANEDKSNNLIIKARPNAREVYAIYTRDEFKMELTIKLPVNYPLGSVQIDGGKRVGVTDLKWRSWLLQLTTFLSHQNGPILDGIDLWRKNIDKRFEGIEKCMICFSILHSNYQLPKKKCITCTKMFHNLCLYKWFETSGNSTCPLCRNIW